MMQQHRLHVDDIEIGERHRALSDDAVARLAESMKEIGLRQPITVRIVDEMEIDGQLTAGVPVLVAGRHRLEAAKLLKWSHIDCAEIDNEEISAELWEIAENLHRHDLTKEQRDQHIRRYAELLEAKAAIIPPQNAAVLPRGRGQPKGVARQIADATGLSDDTVRRALNPSPPTPIRLPIADTDAVTRQFNAIVAAWDRACPEARERFLETVDQPIFDRTRAAG